LAPMLARKSIRYFDDFCDLKEFVGFLTFCFI
jgi:hypothetical protein